MKRFARLFETEEYGQILVIVDEDADDPSVVFLARPGGFGVSSARMGVHSWEAAFSAVERISKEDAVEIAEKAFRLAEKASASIDSPVH